MTFAIPAELDQWLGATTDVGTANLALAVATAAIRTHCQWSITEESPTVKIDGNGRYVVWLPAFKVTAVTTVKDDGVTLTDVTDFEWTTNGKLTRLHRCWPVKARAIEVTFTHGYPVVPDDVKGVCLEIAGRVLQNPTGTAGAHSIDDFSESISADGAQGVSLSAFEMASLKPYRLAPVAW